MIVPGSHVKLERTWSCTSWRLANSTARSATTPDPDPAISSISSKVTWRRRWAVGATRGSAVKTPVTSV